MTEKTTSLEIVSEEKPVMIGSVPLNELVQPVDFSGAASAGTPTRIQINKPRRDEWVTVRPGEEWRLKTGLFEDRINRDTYLVQRSLWPELAGEVFPAVLFLAISRQGNVLLWPCKLPGVDGRSNTWNESALAAARIAESRWVRMSANMSAGMYDTVEAIEQLSDPSWPPDLTFPDVLKLCFRDRFIDSLDHPIVRALRGEA